MNKSRLEAFSDGVIAIIITIMVLELKIPEHDRWDDLFKQWPLLLSYVISFVYVGIYWTNHHHLIYTVRQVNGAILWSNLLLLFFLSLVPVLTAWVGESRFAPIPMTAYAINLLLCGAAYTVLQRNIMRSGGGNDLLIRAIGDDAKGRISVGGYIVAAITPFFGQFGAIISGIITVAIAVMWFIPDRRIERALANAPDLET